MEKNLTPQSQSSLGFFGIIRESLKTTSRNGKLLLPTLLLVFLASSQLDFAQKYILAPVAKDFVFQLAKHPNMVHDLTYNIDQTTYVGALDDVREILLVKLLILVISSVISLVFLVATVSSSSEAYTAKVLSRKDMFLKIKASWKRPLVTSFYMILLTFGIISLYLISIGVTSILAVNSWAVVFFGAITLSIPVCYFYVAALWMVSVVVSVLEEDFVGVKAIGRAAELMKGKKLQASLMMVLFAMFYGVVHMMANCVTSHNLSQSTRMAITIPFTNGLFSLLKLFMFVVFTVFYHERKTSHDEKEGKGFYLPIAAADQA
ncbi:hypothetical protein OSB04_014862 [Centaurea solstitialis]|uniref:Transmembrane protein n=1 Tax=Centaurea solstitialis TaxID=347529 RepID=A0AA38W8E0_9ASTR|nr:hypothetical protein OSB04_014862 [Centaurea solstitialis]